jgi:hypothetical protein
MNWKYHKLNGAVRVEGNSLVVPLLFDQIGFSYDFMIDPENASIGPGFNIMESTWQKMRTLWHKQTNAVTYTEVTMQDSNLKQMVVGDWKKIISDFNAF